mmetsp:Transcript_1569/g.6843  ORF Transcript_1569/g.6843 Transcript_1569/m.6843 type:complete len:187 (+) Transcript_1569:73-633(+)|eukprot:scaffold29_cov251-Pinguiococcus_pyrenoidosus.AAC.8
MHLSTVAVALSLACATAWKAPVKPARHTALAATSTTPSTEVSTSDASAEPLLLRAAKGQVVERPPVWMMRQAGRHMQVYRDLVPKYPTFRERSENPEISYEISMQPYRAYETDGVILFSDILTPLPGMNVPFDIKEKEGPKMPPMTTKAQVDSMKLMDPVKDTPFVGEVLGSLRKAVGNDATVLGE